MGKPRLAVITNDSSDLLEVIQQLDPNVMVLKPYEIPETDLDSYDAFAILGGVSDTPLLFTARERVDVEAQIKKGKRVFAEYTASIGHVYCEPPESTRFQRLVFCSEETKMEGLDVGMLLDDQCGTRIKPHAIACSHGIPLLQYTTANAHDRIVLEDEFFQNVSDRALWFEDPDNLLICSFRLTHFIRGRFAPKKRIAGLVSFICDWLIGTPVPAESMKFSYTTGSANLAAFSAERVKRSADRAMRWFESSGMLTDEGRSGILEGLGTEIYPDGSQRISKTCRADCIGEVSLSFFLHYLLESHERSAVISNRMHEYIFDYYFTKDFGYLHGMMRWTEEAWGICYQDDVARAVIPQLLKCFYTNTTVYLEESVDALQFLVNTTGIDGTRVFRTDNIDLSPERITRLQQEPGNLPSAHYNGYYNAALFLAYRLTGVPTFLQTGLKGVETIMSRYPETIREQSETQEYCRLILPLSWLYWITGETIHKEWLYRVTKDLQKMKHASGAYLEWDEGYKAQMRSEAGEGESSLLAKNGDPVADLLYSNNWLPLSFIQAYFVTKDEYFLSLWQDSAAFLIGAQIQSENKMIDGAWVRAFDVNLSEVFGSPADRGWGPWAIESGWTVAEIVSGLYMGLMKERLSVLY